VDYSELVKQVQSISGSDCYNVRTMRVDISHCPSLFYVFLPNYQARDEPEPNYEFYEDHFEITYSFISRNTQDIFTLLKFESFVEKGYEMAVEQACKNSSWKDEEECVIQVQFPFQVEDKRKYAISGKW